MTDAAPWMSYAFQLAGRMATGEADATRDIAVLRKLPGLLRDGASPLEIARRTETSRSQVSALLERLATYRVVQASTEGSTSAATALYHLTSDGSRFFDQLDQLVSSHPTAAS